MLSINAGYVTITLKRKELMKILQQAIKQYAKENNIKEKIELSEQWLQLATKRERQHAPKYITWSGWDYCD